MSADTVTPYGRGKWGPDDWNTVVNISVNGENRRMITVQASFSFLLLFGVLCLSPVVFFLRKSRREALREMPLIATMGAMFSMVGAMMTGFAYCVVQLQLVQVKKIYLVSTLMSALLEPATYSILFYVFYTIVHLFRDRILLKTNTKFTLIIKYVHWMFVGVFTALVIVGWSWFVLYINSTVHDEFIFIKQSETFGKIDAARCILFWLGAWEILAWSLYLGLMASRDSSKTNIKMAVYFFVAACGFFLATNFVYFIYDIMYDLGDSIEVAGEITAGANAIQEVLRFVFVQGCFFALIMCYWRLPGPEQEPKARDIEEVISEDGIIDRTGQTPTEVEGNQPNTHSTDKNGGLFEADNSRASDVPSFIPGKTTKLSQVEGSIGVLEADSKLLHEAA